MFDPNVKGLFDNKNVSYLELFVSDLVSSQIHIVCINLVNFGRNFHIFAFSCIIFLNFALNTPKHPENTQNDCKHGPKMGYNGPQKTPKCGRNRVLRLTEVVTTTDGVTHSLSDNANIYRGSILGPCNIWST